MKCPNCGAEVHGKICEYCGSVISDEKADMNTSNSNYDETTAQKHNDANSICRGCPKCGCSKIIFKRERVGIVTHSSSRKKYIGSGRKGQSVSQSQYRTIGVCQNCGYTWNSDGATKGTKRRTWLWVLGWICIFPVPLTILMLRKKDMKPAIKYGIIAVAWILFLAIAISGNNNTDTTRNSDSTQVESSQSSQSNDDASSDEMSDAKENDADDSIAVENETASSDSYADLNNFIEDINAASDIKIISQEEIDIHDKSGGYYRTEFRLAAFDNAVAYHIVFDDNSSADLIDTAIDGFVDRIYVLASSMESFEDIFRTSCKIMHTDIMDSDIDEAIEEMIHPYKYEEMEYLYSSGSGLVGDTSYTYSIKEKDSYFDFFID